MSFDDAAVYVENVSKVYHIYERPQDRLKQMVVPKMRRILRRPDCSYAKEFWALRDVSFSVARGETVGIIGRNGSGKSTLLQIICGTLNPSNGGVRANGRIAALLELGSGFNPEFTGRENVYMNAAVLGLSRSETAARFASIVSFADIGAFIDQPIKSYSSGMVVRLAFAVAINVDPQILIVDEALSVGDELFQRKCFSRIAEIKKNGATILFVSHSGAQVIELCDRAVLLDAGEQLVVGSPKEIVGKYQKLLYAPEDKREGIRRGIRQGRAPVVENFLESAAVELGHHIDAALQPKINLLKPFYDPYLKPTSTIDYESHGAVITAARIETLDGVPVNNLVRNGRYRYRYDVRFESAAVDVRFGMLIKTMTGIELGGGSSAASLADAIAVVAAGTRMAVSFEFDARLNTGVYFMNAGIVGRIGQADDGYLHRLVDVAMFRILPEVNNCTTAIVDFGCQPFVETIRN